jgi:ribosomal protein L7/L12
MSVVKKVAAGVLIGLGSLFLAAGLYAPFNKTITSEKRDSEFAACLAFGAPLTLWGIWITWGIRQQNQKQGRDRLQASFFGLLQQGNGRITPLSFAMATGLTGEMAKTYLDERAREFSANFDVDDAGNMFYCFNLSGVSLSDSSMNKVQPQKQPLVVGQSLTAQGNFDVILDAVPSVHKIAGIKIVRELTGLGLKEAKDLVEAAPTLLTTGVSEAIAQQCKKQLEGIGARVRVIEN